MSIFAKKSDPEHGSRGDGSLARPYGIAEAILLLRSLPTDQNSELIVQVVRTTLESMNVHLSDIIDDATRKQVQTEERIAAVHGQVSDLEKQLAALRQEIGGLEAELKETSDVKERLQAAEKSVSSARVEAVQTLSYGQHAPPPVPRGARTVG